VLKLA